jgi:DNA-binding transcriptional regulator YdaS (Cro superfamily)
MQMKDIIKKHSALVIAERMGESNPQTVSNWVSRAIPEGKVFSFCKAVFFEVTPHELRPDMYPHPEDGLPIELRASYRETA